MMNSSPSYNDIIAINEHIRYIFQHKYKRTSVGKLPNINITPATKHNDMNTKSIECDNEDERNHKNKIIDDDGDVHVNNDQQRRCYGNRDKNQKKGITDQQHKKRVVGTISNANECHTPNSKKLTLLEETSFSIKDQKCHKAKQQSSLDSNKIQEHKDISADNSSIRQKSETILTAETYPQPQLSNMKELPDPMKLFKNTRLTFFKYNDDSELGNAFMRSDPNYGQNGKEDLKDTQPILVRVGIHSHIIQPSYMKESGSMCFTELWSKKSKANYYHNINKNHMKIVRISDSITNPLREIDGVFKPEKISKVVHILGKIQELNCGYDYTKKNAERDIKRPPIMRYNPEQDYKKVKDILDKKESLLELSQAFNNVKHTSILTEGSYGGGSGNSGDGGGSTADFIVESGRNSLANSIKSSPNISPRNAIILENKTQDNLSKQFPSLTSEKKYHKKTKSNKKFPELLAGKSHFFDDRRNSPSDLSDINYLSERHAGRMKLLRNEEQKYNIINSNAFITQSSSYNHCNPLSNIIHTMGASLTTSRSMPMNKFKTTHLPKITNGNSIKSELISSNLVELKPEKIESLTGTFLQNRLVIEENIIGEDIVDDQKNPKTTRNFKSPQGIIGSAEREMKHTLKNNDEMIYSSNKKSIGSISTRELKFFNHNKKNEENIRQVSTSDDNRQQKKQEELGEKEGEDQEIMLKSMTTIQKQGLLINDDDLDEKINIYLKGKFKDGKKVSKFKKNKVKV